MKTRIIFSLIILLLSILAACRPAPAQEAEPTPILETAVPTPEISPEPVELTVQDCPASTGDAYQLIHAAQGICFLYPRQFDLFQGNGDEALTLYVRSPLNTEAPAFSVEFEPAGGRSLEEVVAQFLIDYALPDNTTQETMLGGEEAIIIDNLPGQDLSRHLFALHNDMVYHLSVLRIGADYGEVGQQAEALFSLVTGSFTFIAVEPEAAVVAGPECPEGGEGMSLYTNIEDGFCLLLPDGYTADDSLTTESGGGETAVYVDSIQDTAHARLFITVEDAPGQTLEEVTASREAEIESGFEGFDVIWTFGYLVDGELSNQFDQVPGQDLSREVLVVHEGRLYTLSFIPDDPESGATYEQMLKLYETVMDSFSFLMN